MAPTRFPPAPRGFVSEGLIRVGPLMATPAVLESFGVDPAPLLAEFGIRPDFFADPENVLPFATMGRIFCRCVERSGCSHFGLLVGRRAGVSALGAVGFLMQSAPDVRTALDELVHYLHLHDRGALVSVETGGPYASLGYTILQHGVPCSEQILAGAITIGLNIMRGLCGADWRPEETHFAFRAPEDVAPYRECFGPRLRFDAEVTSIVFPSRWLDQPLPGADPLLHRLMEERIGELELRAGEGLVAQVRRGMRALVLTPDCTLDAAARLAGMHGRTLNRRLSALGTSFFELREEARREVACQLLERTNQPANQIAAILGYTDASSFTRAFRRWSGTGPAEWRASRAGRPATGGRKRKAPHGGSA